MTARGRNGPSETAWRKSELAETALAAELAGRLPELLQPQAYGHPVGRVSMVQTHLSWVLLAGDFAYKVRRPVNFEFVDFTTLGRRRADCHREVALNRDLAPGVYLSVDRIVDRAGALRIGGRGRLVDYAVRMRRLPADSFLDHLIAAGRASDGDLGRLARRLALFHATAPRDPAAARFGRPAVLAANWRQSIEQWRPWVGRLLATGEDAEIRTFVRGALRRLRPALLARIDEGMVREVHGDLRACQVAIEEGVPLILDRLQFSRRLRCTDVAADVAFLAMDLESLGRADLAHAFTRTYVESTGDAALLPLLPLYLAHRAAVRAKVAALRSAQIEGQERRDAEAESARFFQQTLGHIRGGPRFLVVLTGLSGTGKSTVAAELGRCTGAQVISTDLTRKRLAGVGPLERGAAGLDAGIYTPEWTRRTYDSLYRSAAGRLRAGDSVILDGAFLRREERRRAVTIAERAGARFLAIETVATEDDVRERLARRSAAGTSSSDATWPVYVAQRGLAEPVLEFEAARHLRVNTDRGPAAARDEALRRLFAQFME